MKKYFFSFLSLLILITSCKQNQTETIDLPISVNKNIPSVNVKVLMLSDAPIPIHSVGTVARREVQNLSFKTGGLIERIYVSASQKISKGQLLAKLRMGESKTQLSKARALFDKTERDLEKIQKMYADTAVTLEQLESLKTKATLAKADLELAEMNVNYTELVAPSNGKILRQFVQSNEVIAPGIPVFQFTAKGQKGLIIKTGITDKDIVKVQLGDKAKLSFDAYPNQVFTAFVSQISEAANPLTGTFEIELSFLSPPQELIKSGFVCTIELTPKKQSPYFKIDINSLVEGTENSAKIFLLKQEAQKYIAEKVAVFPEYINHDFFLTSDTKLKEGDFIITEGAAGISDKMEVIINEEMKEN